MKMRYGQLIDRYLKKSILVKKPLHVHQYAYQAGKSTDLALHHLVRKVEGALGSSKACLGDVQLHYSRIVRFLGIKLDPKLSWYDHADTRMKKATCTLWACRRAFGNTWGLSPKILHWIYLRIVRPLLTYGAIVWWSRTEKAKIRAQLDRVQRLACLSITGSMRTAATRALETLLSLPPLDFVVQFEAMRTAYRLYVLGELRAGETDHAKIWSRAIQECPLLLMGSDCMAPVIVDCEGFVMHIADGSRMNNRAGSGLCGGIPHTSTAYSLREHATVFQAKVFAVLKCGQKILSCEHRNTVVSIGSDSRAASTAAKVGCRVQSCQTGIRECADGTGTHSWYRQIRCGRVNEGLLDKWTHRRWTESPGMRQAKAHIGGPSACLTKNLLRLKRREIRLVTGLLTGHWHLRSHLHTIGIADNPECRWCCEEDETVDHVVGECPALTRPRFKYLDNTFTSTE
ncbi:uncharacterized protein LOC126737392 isoform X2 [Anthonomus grandis grandis]|uniref:uncharacterized protein LOC126737392 isoform X2 n=1 Tax=Anthonomus grandis grandis TaxID=2921223 RepID=UPI002166B9D3|nr:uncharacterized protein LOC126737392 isoform X2 [Anthonomus grandis grandis]